MPRKFAMPLVTMLCFALVNGRIDEPNSCICMVRVLSNALDCPASPRHAELQCSFGVAGIQHGLSTAINLIMMYVSGIAEEPACLVPRARPVAARAHIVLCQGGVAMMHEPLW